MTATPVHDITVTLDGVDHRGSWFVIDGLICVRSPLGSKTTWIRHLDGAQSIAELLFSEIVRDR